MRRTMPAAAAAFLLVMSSPAAVPAGSVSTQRYWVSPAEKAPITSCLTGNSAVIYPAQNPVPGTSIATITGRVTFCEQEQGRYFGLEFFSSIIYPGQNPPVAGYFLTGVVAGSSGETVDFSFTGDGFERVTALCASAAPNDRLACARVSIDGKTGAVSLTPIPVGDPLVTAPSGPMYFCDPGEHHVDPTCVTCV